MSDETAKNYLMSELSLMLSAGMCCPPERMMQVLGSLPEEFEANPGEYDRVSCLKAVTDTCRMLDIWIPFSQKANRFGADFIRYSGMVAGAVTTVARGLVTLHRNGENLSQCPKSIEDLLDIASFQFNKSCNGAKTAFGVNEQVFERLLDNQLRWLNMLLRLERTQEQLNKKPLPAGETVSLLPANEDCLSGISELRPASAVGAARPFQPLMKSNNSHYHSSDNNLKNISDDLSNNNSQNNSLFLNNSDNDYSDTKTETLRKTENEIDDQEIENQAFSQDPLMQMVLKDLAERYLKPETGEEIRKREKEFAQHEARGPGAFRVRCFQPARPFPAAIFPPARTK